MSKHIEGYRDQPQSNLDVINTVKRIENDVAYLIANIEKGLKARSDNGITARRVNLAKTNLEQGFMWLVKAIANPEGGIAGTSMPVGGILQQPEEKPQLEPAETDAA